MIRRFSADGWHRRRFAGRSSKWVLEIAPKRTHLSHVPNFLSLLGQLKMPKMLACALVISVFLNRSHADLLGDFNKPFLDGEAVPLERQHGFCSPHEGTRVGRVGTLMHVHHCRRRDTMSKEKFLHTPAKSHLVLTREIASR
jgi:hypothetical protein